MKIRRFFAFFTAVAVAFAAISCEDQFDESQGDDQTEETPGEQPEQPENPGQPSDSLDTPKPDQPVKPVIPEKDVTPDPESGISIEPTKPDADGSCTIRFKALPTNEFVGYTGDVYVHIGVIIDGEWTAVESQWDVNDDKFKLTSDGNGEWHITIDNIRQFFPALDPTTPLIRLGMVIRSAEEVELQNEKGETYSAKLQTRPDQFVSCYDNINAYVPFQPAEVVYETMPSGLEHGINYTGTNQVTLVFYEKDKNGKSYDNCYVIGDFTEWERKHEFAMKRDDAAGCWWTTITVDDPDKEYRFQYRLTKGEEDVRVQDPYSEIYYHGDDRWITSSTYPDLPTYPETGARGFIGAFQINRPEYSWRNPNPTVDKTNFVVYELLFRDFTPSGDIAGAMAKLDYLEALGVNAIELMPIQEFEGNDSWGYNPIGYFALDKAYGTREMYKEFIDECHGRGIAVIVDVVYNHTTGGHPWARLYWNGEDNVSDNNPWYNVITPHGFGVNLDLNHQNQMVNEHVKKSLKYLVDEYHVDGFRFDLTKGFINESGKDNSYSAQRVGILKDYNKYIKEHVKSDAIVILEHFVGDENYDLGHDGMLVWQNMNNAYCQSAMGYSSDSSFHGLLDSEWNRFGTYVGFMESHDEERMAYKQTAFGSIGGGTSTGGVGEKWGLIGLGGNWDTDVVMTFVDGMYFADNVSFTATDNFKFRKDGKWDVNYGLNPKGTKVNLNALNLLLTSSDGGEDMAIAAGTYDVYFLPSVGAAWFMSDNQKPASFWGVVGTMTGWAAGADIAMTGTEDGYFVAKDVTVSASDRFKIRGGGTWDDRFNYGASTAGTISTNTGYKMTLGAGSQDMTVAAGTYDVWFQPSSGTVWVMTQGLTPSESNVGSAAADTPHSIYMRRLGLNAAFFLTVPGPKMIWQFGELGYDLSINYPSNTEGDRTTKKPSKWEYLADADRVNLYNTYCELMRFRNENPHFFTDTAYKNFAWWAGQTGDNDENEWEYGRFIQGKADGKFYAVMGNFSSSDKEITMYAHSAGTWTDWFTGKTYTTKSGSSNNEITAFLKQGEFLLLTK